MTNFNPRRAKLFYGGRIVSAIHHFAPIAIDTSDADSLSRLKDTLTEKFTKISGGFKPNNPQIRVWETSRGTKHISFNADGSFGCGTAFEASFKEVK